MNIILSQYENLQKAGKSLKESFTAGKEYLDKNISAELKRFAEKMEKIVKIGIVLAPEIVHAAACAAQQTPIHENLTSPKSTYGDTLKSAKNNEVCYDRTTAEWSNEACHAIDVDQKKLRSNVEGVFKQYYSCLERENDCSVTKNSDGSYKLEEKQKTPIKRSPSYKKLLQNFNELAKQTDEKGKNEIPKQTPKSLLANNKTNNQEAKNINPNMPETPRKLPPLNGENNNNRTSSNDFNGKEKKNGQKNQIKFNEVDQKLREDTIGVKIEDMNGLLEFRIKFIFPMIRSKYEKYLKNDPYLAGKIELAYKFDKNENTVKLTSVTLIENQGGNWAILNNLAQDIFDKIGGFKIQNVGNIDKDSSKSTVVVNMPCHLTAGSMPNTN